MADEKTPIQKLAEKRAEEQEAVQSEMVLGDPPEPHMSEVSAPKFSDHTKKEMEAGKKANNEWNRRRKAELGQK